MKKSIRYLFLGVIGFTLLVLIGVSIEFIFTRGDTPEIEGEQSIASLEMLELGGVAQSVLIRGHDSSNPILLFLHGGPGMPAMFLAHAFQSDLERDFVVVHWDRRGAGKSYDAGVEAGGLSVSQTLEDTYELTRILRDRFDRDRIYLVGHSWGSYLGLLAVHGHPEYYSAFVGMGQLAGTRTDAGELRREFLARKANAAGDSALLIRLASEDFQAREDDLFRYGGELYGAQSFWPILRTGLFAPEYTLWDALNVKKGADFVARAMKYDVVPKPLQGEIAEFDVPIFFFLGRHDYNTPSRLAADYLARLEAPLKQVVWFENSAHFPFFEQPARFHSEMVRLHETVEAFWREHSHPSIK